jgi:hypothetical protein
MFKSRFFRAGHFAAGHFQGVGADPTPAPRRRRCVIGMFFFEFESTW